MTAPVAAAAPPGRLRLDFLDGIRGLAAFYVLIFHSLTIDLPQPEEDLSWPMETLRDWFGYGHFAVAVFIVLSGFSLGLPLARKGILHLDRGFGNYIWRRSRRVLPPYYAALVVSIIAILAASVVPGGDTSARDEALTPGSVWSHVFLIHNWNFDWVYRINGPMWSVATEWQIYFLFPLVLLPLWRWLGAVPTVLIAWAIPLIVNFSLPATSNFSWAAPWFVGSFAMGVWGAFAMYGPDSGSPARWRGLPWAWIALGSFVFLVTVLAVTNGSWDLSILDLIVSVMSVAFIASCVAAFEAQRAADVGADRPVGVRINDVLGSRPLVALGAFSYSLYLLQHPLLRFTEALLGESNVGYETALWIQLIVGTPFIMLVSRVFAEFFEMPFTTGSTVVDSLKQRRRLSRQSDAEEQSVNA